MEFFKRKRENTPSLLFKCSIEEGTATCRKQIELIVKQNQKEKLISSKCFWERQYALQSLIALVNAIIEIKNKTLLTVEEQI